MIRRETDAALANRIASDPAVRGNVCYHDGPIDFAPAVDACILLSNGTDALAAFEETAPREWQMHSFFLPSCRGRKAIDTAKEMLAWMIPARADRVWGGTPLTNKAARWFNRQIGGASIGFDEFEVEGPVEIFEMRAA